MWKILMFIFCILVFAISAYEWYYIGGEHRAFNTGLYYVLSIWSLNMVLEDRL